jgi:peptidoglycan/xylan/chitin deacetylase (PgdA/CDA1 family)
VDQPGDADRSSDSLERDITGGNPHEQETDAAVPAVRQDELRSELPHAGLRLTLLPPQGRLSRPRLVAAPLAIAALLVAIVLGTLGVGLWQWTAFGLAASPKPTASDKRAPIPTPTATPSAPIDFTAELNARQQVRLNNAAGCAEGSPPASTRVIYGARDFETGGQAPNEFALTFDDGPTPFTSPPILDYLEQTHTPATFFVMGAYARAWPDLIQREWRDGFAIGVHTWDHPSMPLVPDSQMPHQFGDTLVAIHAAIGEDACVWLWRPPYGDQNPRVVGWAERYGLTTIEWNDDPRDWARPGTEAIVRTLLAEARPGGIVVMHDGPAHREQTAAALPLILEGLRTRGLIPVTLPRLLADSHYPGVYLAPSQRRTPVVGTNSLPDIPTGTPGGSGTMPNPVFPVPTWDSGE